MDDEMKKYYSRWPKARLIDRLLEQERLAASLRAQRDDYSQRGFTTEQALTAARTSLADLEKVQQELVARLEQAYLAVVKAVLR